MTVIQKIQTCEEIVHGMQVLYGMRDQYQQVDKGVHRVVSAAAARSIAVKAAGEGPCALRWTLAGAEADAACRQTCQQAPAAGAAAPQPARHGAGASQRPSMHATKAGRAVGYDILLVLLLLRSTSLQAQ